MTFKIARLKLTSWYLLIVMAISITFSVVVYKISLREIGTFNHRQSVVIRSFPQSKFIIPFLGIEEFERLREAQLNDLKKALVKKLFLTNTIILILAGISSYFLAHKTLQPIEQAMDNQNRFTSDASHELRTPLAAMKLEIEVALRDKELNFNEAKKLLKSNLEEVEKLENLSNSLLKLASFENRQVKKSVFFEVQKAVDSAIDRIKKSAKSKNISIEKEISNFKLKGDESSFTDLIVLLLDNAIKYSGSGSVISVVSQKEKKNSLIKIIDRGIGIKRTDIPYIFNRFYCADQSRSKEIYTGYGLGLSIAKRIVEIFNGQILVESKIGEGSTFIIKLPLIS